MGFNMVTGQNLSSYSTMPRGVVLPGVAPAYSASPVLGTNTGFNSSSFAGMGAGIPGQGMTGMNNSPPIAESTLQLMSTLSMMMASVMQGLMSFIATLMASMQNRQNNPASGDSTTTTTSEPTKPIDSKNTTGTQSPDAPTTQPIAKGRNKDGSNVRATKTMEDYKKRFGVTNLGIWGDEAHKKTKSDHNSGDAADLGISSIEQGKPVADALIKEAEARGVKYIIFNRKIWSVDRKNEGWRPYSGKDPHTNHVHVSFYT